MSAVPPEELPPAWLGLTSIPDGSFPNTREQAVRLYLQPGLPRGLPIFDRGGFPYTRSWGATMAEEGLGGDVRWFVYENVDPTRLGAEVIAALNADPNLARLTLNGQPLTAAQRLEAFLEGQVQVTVAEGAEVGKGSPANASQGRVRGLFGVHTTTGYVDPVAFYVAISEFLTAEAQADLGAFANLVGTDWPVLPVDFLVDALAVTCTQLYPYPVLSWARRKVDGFADLWRSVGDGQKALYWEQLRARSGHSSSGQPFTYNTDEMGNLFQLEAVTEFFMDWVEPSTPGTSPAPAVPVPPKVDLLAPDWNLVVLDPFDHDRLGSPILPRPDYQLAPYTPSQPVAPCEPSVTLPLQVDRYRGALFLVRRGQVVAWHRWSTISSHRWEDSLHQWDPSGSALCNYASSVQGNRKFLFWSRTASEKVPAINYAIQLYDPEALSNYVDYNWSPGRYYFRTGSPMDDGSFASDREAGKTAVMLHDGYANDQHNQQFDYIGSAGCIVSPEYYKLRGRMVALQLASSSEENLDLEVLLGADKARSEGLHKGHILVYKSPYVGRSSWDNQLQGTAYVIRPDEPEQR